MLAAFRRIYLWLGKFRKETSMGQQPGRHICLGFTDETYPEGTHICYLYNNEEERRRILPLFARHALLEGESFDYLADVPTRADLPRARAELGLPRQVAMSTAMEGYYPDGRFDPDAMLARLRKRYLESKAAGLAGARIDALVKITPITVMCQYDLRQFDGALMFEIMNVHPVMIVGGHVLRNPFYQRSS
jgi:hypothetical protein